jgi:flagellar hook protein FlgE
MLGAILTALSGMNAYSEGLQSISNNVANLNTSGFKEQDVGFEELVNPGGSDFFGNGEQPAGYGVETAPSMTDFSQGTLQQTDNPLDLAIQGDGFLAVFNGGQVYYLRTGSFSANQNGFITDQNGDELAILNADNQPEALNINGMQTNAPVATTSVTFQGNVAASSSPSATATVPTVNVFDSSGAEHVWTVTLSSPTEDTSGNGTDWTVTVTDSTGTTVGTGTIEFDNDSDAINPSEDTVAITQDVTGAQPLNVTLDFSGVTSFSAGSSSLQLNTANGNALGTLTGVSVNTSGQVELAYSNGQTTNAGTVALASFQDPQNLQLLPGGLYRASGNDNPQYFASGATGLGTLESGELEASNVNLSTEFGDLILLERGYQACSEVVSISNDMIQTLFGIQGQGGA